MEYIVRVNKKEKTVFIKQIDDGCTISQRVIKSQSGAYKISMYKADDESEKIEVGLSIDGNIFYFESDSIINKKLCNGAIYTMEIISKLLWK